MAHSIHLYESDGGVPALPVNGTDLSTLGITVTKAQFQDQADMAVEGLTRGNAGGVIVQTPRLKARFLNLVLVLEGDSASIEGVRASKTRRMDTFKRLIDPRKGELFWVLDRDLFSIDDLDRGFWARLHSPIQSDDLGIANRKFQINLIVPDGVGYTSEALEQSVVIDESPEEFDVPSGIEEVIPGTSPAHPVFIITNNDIVPVSSITLTVTSTIFGQTLVQELNWHGALVPDGMLRIDCDRQIIEMSTDGVVWEYAMAGLGAGNPFPLFGPGGVATVVLEGCEDADLDITYFGEYL